MVSRTPRSAGTRSASKPLAVAGAKITAVAAPTGGTDLVGATRSDAPVVASLVPCSSKSGKRTKVTLRPSAGRISAHDAADRLCIVALGPAAV
jgi:hypothetical protein